MSDEFRIIITFDRLYETDEQRQRGENESDRPVFRSDVAFLPVFGEAIDVDTDEKVDVG